MALNIGEIKYTNILPLFFYLNKKEIEKTGAQFIPQVPAELNRRMARGEIDLGGISSFAYGENSHQYSLFPNLSVSTYGKVGSILLFSKTKIEELDGRSIALTSSSATSVALLKVILKEFLGVNPYYETMTPNYDEMLSSHDACLLIGEDAIKGGWRQEKDIYVYDLGELWYENTNLPMTYAVMAVRNDAIKREAPLLEKLLIQMTESKGRTKADGYQEMIEDVLHEHGGESAFWSHYFQGINYDLSENHIKGLKLYFELAYKHSFIQSLPEFTFFNYSLQGI
ncbi:menaquinone biosynthesis protein [Fictibacillus enclensis]|uniref:menaquinone biosynthesis protein n=1 Tax=Fictibacillus enclensis TaxID=1017270 RepID=UPI0025A287FE|nr:menaquinone biosynthesis protein [Fictibacillus enclensis]MDM5199520.1 menaquinone biosynthesis protein [Fictibacillus enclensis]